MLRKLISLLVLLSLSVLPALAVDSVGLYHRSDPNTISNPVANKTWCLDSTTKELKMYNGSAWEVKILPKPNPSASANPTVDDDVDSGYLPGSIWINTSNKRIWICSDNTDGAAVWNELEDRLDAADIVDKFTTADTISDFKVEGLLGSDPGASLDMTTPSGAAYVDGVRVSVTTGIANTYTASKDTYDYLQSDGTINHIEIPNNDPAPTGQTGLLLQKVVTDGTEITSVVDLSQTKPNISVAAATANEHAVNKGQTDSLYAPISIYASGAQNQVAATPDGAAGVLTRRLLVNNDLPSPIDTIHGGTNNASLGVTNLGLYYGNGAQIVQGPIPTGTLKKFRLNAAGDGFEWVPDVNGTVTDISMSAPNLLFQTPVSIATSTSTPAISLALRTDVAAGKFVGDDGAGSWSERSITAADLPLLTLAIGGLNNAGLSATAWTLLYGDGAKYVETPALGAGQALRRNAAGTAMEAYTPASGSGADAAIFNARLTLTTGVPVTTSDVSGATSVYLTAYKGNRIGIYTGSETEPLSIAGGEISLSLTGLTTSQPYDIFCYDSDSGGDIDTIEAVAWTDSSTRATALVAAPDAQYYVKSGANGRRYCGTLLMSATGQCSDSTSHRGVYNYYNRVSRQIFCTDGTDSWTYNSTSWRSFNGDTTAGIGKFRFVCGIIDEVISVHLVASVDQPGSVGNTSSFGIGLNSTTTNSATLSTSSQVMASSETVMHHAHYSGYPALGINDFYPLEKGGGTYSHTVYGDGGGACKSGLSAIFRN